MSRSSVPLLALLLVVACGDDDGGADASVDAGRQDGAVVLDASLADAGADAGPSNDAAAVDAGEGLACGGSCDPRGQRCGDGLCVLTAAEPVCSLGAGLGGLGDACEVTTECSAGLACFRRREGGVCGRICCPWGGETCGEDEHCGGTGVLVDGSVTRYRECLAPRACDLLRDDNTPCFPGESCFLVGERETDCRVPGEVPVGGACERPEDCQMGTTCVGLFESTCVRVCSLLREGSCPASEGRCVAYAQSPPDTGLCTL